MEHVFSSWVLGASGLFSLLQEVLQQLFRRRNLFPS